MVHSGAVKKQWMEYDDDHLLFGWFTLILQFSLTVSQVIHTKLKVPRFVTKRKLEINWKKIKYF